MLQLQEIIQNLERGSDWKSYIKENFTRKFSNYSVAIVTTLKVKYGGKEYEFPTKVTFDRKYLRFDKTIYQKEQLAYLNKPLIIEKKIKMINLGVYERGKKYSGDIYQILTDIIGKRINSEFNFSKDILSYRDSPLYNIDSTINWSAYLVILKKDSFYQNSVTEPPIDLQQVVEDSGIHYQYDPSLKDKVLVLFPMAYAKIVENKINSSSEGESIFLAFEFNRISLAFNTNIDIGIHALIKNTKGEVIHEAFHPVKYGNVSFQTFEIKPSKAEEIGYASFSLRINDVEVDRTSGFYIRNIKVGLKFKENE